MELTAIAWWGWVVLSLIAIFGGIFVGTVIVGLDVPSWRHKKNDDNDTARSVSPTRRARYITAKELGWKDDV